MILILSHGRDQGTLGLILNRPGPQRLHSLPGLQADLAEVFGDSQVCGMYGGGRVWVRGAGGRSGGGTVEGGKGRVSALMAHKEQQRRDFSEARPTLRLT